MKRHHLFALLAIALVSVSARSAGAATIFAPGDPISPIWKTVAGGDSTASAPGTAAAGNFPAAEAAPNAIDGKVATKYLNFGTGGGAAVSTVTKGVGTGFYITPKFGPSIATGVQFTTANDEPARDPISISLEGTNATGADLTLGASWAVIFTGNAGLDVDPGRQKLGLKIDFPNTVGYSSYRLLITAQRANANSVQYSEVQLFGTTVPEPSAALLIALGGVGLVIAARARRRVG